MVLVLVLPMVFANCRNTSHTSLPVNQHLVDNEGNRYRTIKVGRQQWMAENLRVTRAPDGSAVTAHAPNDDSTLVGTYGRLYQWNDALRVCPGGWHLPSDTEWTMLEAGLANMPGSSVKDDSCWKGKNPRSAKSVSFAARPAGYWNDQGFENYFGSRAVFWTSTAKDSHFVWSRVIGDQTNEFRRADQHPQYGFSVRCVAPTDQESERQ